jgi:hypothetical protein
VCDGVFDFGVGAGRGGLPRKVLDLEGVRYQGVVLEGRLFPEETLRRDAMSAFRPGVRYPEYDAVLRAHCGMGEKR